MKRWKSPMRWAATLAALAAGAFAAPQGIPQVDPVDRAILRAGFQTVEERIALPELGFTDLSGKPADFAAFEGRPMILNFWSTRCFACTLERPGQAKLTAQFAGQDLAFVGVSTDSGPADAIRAYVARHPMKYPVVWDRSGEASLFFGVRATPSTYIVNRDGFVVGGGVGAREWDAPEVAAMVRALQDEAPSPTAAGE